MKIGKFEIKTPTITEGTKNKLKKAGIVAGSAVVGAAGVVVTALVAQKAGKLGITVGTELTQSMGNVMESLKESEVASTIEATFEEANNQA